MRSHSKEPGLVSGLWKVLSICESLSCHFLLAPHSAGWRPKSPFRRREDPEPLWGHSWNGCLRPLQAGDNVRARPFPGQWGGSDGGLLEEPASTGDLKEGWEAESLKQGAGEKRREGGREKGWKWGGMKGRREGGNEQLCV